jgi:hypothetical protein
MTKLAPCILALALLCAAPAVGQDVPALDRMTLDQINALSPEQVRVAPVRKLLMKSGAEMTPAASDLVLGSMLAMLQYDVHAADGFTADELQLATAAFQSDLGQPSTGEMTVAQFEELGRRLNEVNATPVYVLGQEPTVHISKDFGIADGTWQIIGDTIAFPINRVNIECFRQFGHCFVSRAHVDVGTGSTSTPLKGSYSLHLATELHLVTSWTATEISMEGGGDCRRTTITMNANSGEVVELTRNNTKGECEGIPLPKLDQPRVARFVHSFRTSYDFFQEHKKLAHTYKTSAYQELMERLKTTK